MSDGSINFCNDEPTPGDGTINFCEEGPGDNNGTISFCEEEQPGDQTCEGVSPLSLTGSDAPSNGSVYYVTGGQPPYRWSVTGGATLSASGSSATISNVSGNCGTGTVSVSDACGQSASLTIRYPNGQWTLQSECNATRTAGDGCDGSPKWTGTIYEGAYRYDASVRCCQFLVGACTAGSASAEDYGGACSSGLQSKFFDSVDTYLWECI